MRRIAIAAALLPAGACVLAFACGTNLLKSSEKKDPAEDATIDLEHNNPSAAITVLEDALVKDPGNPKLLSILSLAYAQRAGIEPLAFGTKLAAAQGSSGGSASPSSPSGNVASAVGQDFSKVFAVLPDASADHLADLDKAVNILTTQIAPAHLQPGDTFKMAIFQSASFTLHLKAIDTNGDGIIEADEIINLSDTDAASLVTQLASAAAALGANPSDTSSVQAAAAIAKYQTQIDAAPGATTSEKLKNFLAANPNATATLTGTGTGTFTLP